MADEDENPDSDEADSKSSNGDRKTEQVRLQIQAYQRQLRRLTSELSLAEARERREIASDLHDHIGQALAYVSQKMTLLQGNAVFSGMEEDISEIVSILGQTIRYTRDLTVEISPPVLYELGLPAAIDWLAERASQRYGIQVDSKQTGKAPEVSEDVKVFIFKAIQELITNVSKHASATRVTITTRWLKDNLEIIVSDDGCGFDAELMEKHLTGGNCFGLFSIRERLSYTGGSVQIQSSPGGGTRITITTPYHVSGADSND